MIKTEMTQKETQKLLTDWFRSIVRERDRMLREAQNIANESNINIAETYKFATAHGLTRSIILFDKAEEKFFEEKEREQKALKHQAERV